MGGSRAHPAGTHDWLSVHVDFGLGFGHGNHTHYVVGRPDATDDFLRPCLAGAYHCGVLDLGTATALFNKSCVSRPGGAPSRLTSAKTSLSLAVSARTAVRVSASPHQDFGKSLRHNRFLIRAQHPNGDIQSS